jgi:hypothetical protein
MFSMRKVILVIILMQISLIQYGQIIADHTVVDKYDKIPQNWIDIVKTKLVWVPGLSHSLGYQHGVELLEILNETYQATAWNTSTPPAKTSSYLRLGRPWMTGEEGFYTNASGISTFKGIVDGQNITGNPYDVICFGWCYTFTWTNAPGGTIDPVYHVRWAGSSAGGPNGNTRWGLDSGDQSLTGNSVCMDTYLAAIEEYNTYFTSKGYPTKVVFTTGPVDNEDAPIAGTENGFQRELKQDHIREYVASHPDAILFDYADILCWNDAGEKFTAVWNDGGNMRPHAHIHPDNLVNYQPGYDDPYGADHVGEAGALRLGKAMWWMLARMAGWDGSIVTGTDDLDQDMLWSPLIKLSKDKLRIELSESGSPSTVSLYNLYGTQIEIKKAYGNTIEFNITQLTPGIYFIVLSESKVKKTHKIIIP